MRRRTLWYVVTPVYSPAPGGGAIYTKLLAEALAQDGLDVVVATEAFPHTATRERAQLGNGSLVLDRLFPMRAGRAEIDWRSYTAYAWQNALMLSLPNRLARAMDETGSDSAVVLIHSSFFYKKSLMPVAIRAMRRQLASTVRLVVDVRDPLFEDSLASVFARFDAAIGCSRFITERLRAVLPGAVDVHHIPIPFESETAPSDDEVASTLTQFGLDGIPYLLNPNGILEAKRYPAMLEVVRALRGISGYEDTVLVTFGRSRDWEERDDAAVDEGVLKYVGVIPNRTAMALTMRAKSTLILSEIEGMPRSALETLALGKPLIVPPLAEFLEHIPGSVLQSADPEDIARQIIRISEKPSVENYPLHSHGLTSLVPRYRELESCRGSSSERPT